MKQLKSTVLWLAVASVVSLCNSCAKDGDTGPQGPAGNANVLITKDTILTTQWLSGGSGAWYQLIQVPVLTDPDNDIVIVDVSRQNNNNWLTLPYQGYMFHANDYTWYNYNNGTVSINYNGSSAPNTQLYIKIAVIPPG